MNAPQDFYIPIENISSESQVRSISQAIVTATIFLNHDINLTTQQIHVVSSKPDEELPQLYSILKNLGFKIPTIKKTFPVTGMSCAGCVESVNDALLTDKSIISVDANYANASATIEYLPTISNPTNFKSTLQTWGYDMILEETNEAQELIEQLQATHFRELKRKTIGALLLTIPIVVIAMTPELMHLSWANPVMWLLSTPVLFYFGNQFFIGAVKQAKNKAMNMDTLVALSTSVAYIFSVFNTLNPHYWHEKGLHPHVYFEASAVIITFILLGKLLEERAKGNTSSAIKKLMGLQPKEITILVNNEARLIPIAEVQIGHIIIVKPGEKIAVDGVLVSGSSYIDESLLSGEPIPVSKQSGDKVYSGTINQKGTFLFRAEKVGSSTLLAQIIHAVKEAQGSKPPVQKLVDKISSIFVPTIIGIALLTFVCWMLFGGENSFTHALLAMVTVLIIACPCSLGLATPTAIMVGIGKAAENGILIKDASSLESAHNVDAILLDKTGTITLGKPVIHEIRWFQEQPILSDILYSIERMSEHPLADAITKHLEKSAQLLPTINVENKVGRGIQGIYEGKTYFIGNKLLLEEQLVHFDSQIHNWYEEQLKSAFTTIFFATNEGIIAGITISDQIKPTSKNAISQLQEKGISVYMLTGDNLASAQAIAKQVNIKYVFANVLPEQKEAFVVDLQNQGLKVAMVGDGVNDSSALARADLSIAMGKGSDIAMDVAKMTIISGDLNKIDQAIQISKLTSKTIRQNLFWAFIYNLIGIPLAAGLLYPINGFLLDPMIAGAAMALSSVSVVTNSLLLNSKKHNNHILTHRVL